MPNQISLTYPMPMTVIRSQRLYPNARHRIWVSAAVAAAVAIANIAVIANIAAIAIATITVAAVAAVVPLLPLPLHFFIQVLVPPKRIFKTTHHKKRRHVVPLDHQVVVVPS